MSLAERLYIVVSVTVCPRKASQFYSFGRAVLRTFFFQRQELFIYKISSGLFTNKKTLWKQLMCGCHVLSQFLQPHSCLHCPFLNTDRQPEDWNTRPADRYEHVDSSVVNTPPCLYRLRFWKSPSINTLALDIYPSYLRRYRIRPI